MLIRCIVLKINDDLKFLQIWLEMPPKFGFLGLKYEKAFADFDPNLISSSDSDPKGSDQIS